MNKNIRKINIIGTSGSGKSTFGRQLAAKLDIPYVEMDALYWKPNWQEPSDEEFFANLEKALQQDSWILDGNYNRTAPIKFAYVQSVIWIDYSFVRTLYQAVKRAIVRSISQQEIWANTGNKESFRKTFFSKDSIILWTLKTFKNNRVRYQALLNDPNYSHIHFVRLKSPTQAKAFLESLD
ncbi:shikimate kinase [Vibrio porteresiae]|uniref:Shikimate kinase n=1 Tax=Vibrio porteresiae DSM 19223 TaxID=1123496 RepID=A0ABZ0Q8M2_9VIBR|nr:shikimate kinase [Vibrio porteresiae]WPC72270.1 shikimate kinase [Vibrio porteresiae DSM 19223]